MSFEWKFYLFMNPELISLGINNKETATNHWITMGQFEKRIASHVDRNIFDFDYYATKYGSLKVNGIISKRDLLNHWYTHGKNEGRWCYAPQCSISKEAKFMSVSDDKQIHEESDLDENSEILLNILCPLRKRLNIIESKHESIHFRIITRTSRRPNAFSRCRLSVLRQYLPPFIKCFHHILFDDPRDKWYISGDLITYVKKKDTKLYECPFNGYINKALQIHYINGSDIHWNIILDDDDVFIDPYAIQFIAKSIIENTDITANNSLYIWKTKKNDEIFPKTHELEKNTIPSCSYTFHQKYAKLYKWENVRGGDYLFAQNIFEKSPVIWIEKTLTSLQCGPGWGECVDIYSHPLRYKSIQCINRFLNLQNHNSYIIIGISIYGSIIYWNQSFQYIEIMWDNVHFKPKLYISNNDVHSILLKDIFTLYFDNTYVLSLKRRDDRWLNTKRRANKHGIQRLTRFIGIDGVNENECKNLWDKYKKRLINPPCIPSIGSLAILLSMQKLIETSFLKQENSCLILQDDVLFCDNFLNKCAIFLECITKCIPNWKLIYLGCTQHAWPVNRFNTPINSEIGFYYPQGTADGAFAVAIHNSIYEELLEEIGTTVIPFDSGPLRTIQKRYPSQCVCAWPYLIVADVSDSDCRPSRDQLVMANKVEWDMQLFQNN